MLMVMIKYFQLIWLSLWLICISQHPWISIKKNNDNEDENVDENKTKKRNFFPAKFAILKMNFKINKSFCLFFFRIFLSKIRIFFHTHTHTHVHGIICFHFLFYFSQRFCFVHHCVLFFLDSIIPSSSSSSLSIM